jgi:hypothetical protein
MKRLSLVVCIFAIAILGFAAIGWASEASVFDNEENIIIRAWTVPGETPDAYSLYLEARDPLGNVLVPEQDVSVKDISGDTCSSNADCHSGLSCVVGVCVGTPTYDLTYDRYVLHSSSDVEHPTISDVSLSFDPTTGTTYLFCTDGGVMVMKYNITNKKIVPGLCGAAAHTCSTGSVINIADTSTNYVWSCTSIGTSDTPCSLLKPVAGVCGTTAHTCSTGSVISIADTSTNYVWSCTSIGTSDTPCSLLKPVAGVCGTTAHTCSTGSVINIADTSTNYVWSCTSIGTSDTPCSLQKTVPGVCGTTAHTCSTGSVTNIADTSTNYVWSCTSIGTSNTPCSLQIPVTGTPDINLHVGSIPSGFAAGGHTTISVGVSNDGNAPANCKTAANPNCQWTVKATLNGLPAFTLYFDNLNPGETVTQDVGFSWPYAGNLHQWLRFTIWADADQQITESNESNNYYNTSVYRQR